MSKFKLSAEVWFDANDIEDAFTILATYFEDCANSGEGFEGYTIFTDGDISLKEDK